MQSRLALGWPAARGHAAATALAAFVQDMLASGFVAEALRRHSVQGAAVAPLEPTPS